MKSRETIKREMRRLRGIVELGIDPESRIAYAVECALQWVTEDGRSFMPPAQDVAVQGDALRRQWKPERSTE